MDKTHYKELIEKYFEETITDVEIKELSDWIKNDRQLHDCGSKSLRDRIPP